MNIISIMVASVDGKTTAGLDSQLSSWTSSEDQAYFFVLIRNSSVVIMGRHTYEAARSLIRLQPSTLRLVVTSQPERFRAEAVSGQLEFTSESPSALVDRLTEARYDSAYLVGGSSLNHSFLKAGLVSELWLTLEPLILGDGLSLVAGQLGLALELKSVTSLNQQGTLLLKYGLLPPILSREP